MSRMIVNIMKEIDMGLINERVKELREFAEYWKSDGEQPSKALMEAADTIEKLSDKLSIKDMEQSENDWIVCKDRLPEEKINPVTQDFYEYQVTFQSEDVRDIRHYKFGKGHWWNDGEIMDKYVIAWQSLPQPYEESG